MQYRAGATTRAELIHRIEADVRSGLLQPGDRLPSVRELAQQTALSPTTITSAIAELRRRGVVVSHERRALLIAPTQLPRLAAPTSRPGATDLAEGGPDPALLPDLRPTLAVLSHGEPLPSGYVRTAVDAGLAAQLRARCTERGIDAAHLSVANGALDAVERVLGACLRVGDRVAVEDPGYPDVVHLVRAMGYVPVPMAVDDEGPTVAAAAAALAHRPAAFVLTPRAQNPYGACLSADRADALAELLAASPDTLVIEDDHLGLLGPAPATLAGRTRHWLLTQSVAKALGPDLRLAAVVGDPTTMATYDARLAGGAGWVSHLVQRATAHLLADPAISALLERAAHTYDSRRSTMLAELAARGIEAHGRTGFNIWVPVSDEATVALALADQGYTVRPGAPFRLASGPGIRLSVCRLPLEQAPTVADAIAHCVQLGGGRSG